MWGKTKWLKQWYSQKLFLYTQSTVVVQKDDGPWIHDTIMEHGNEDCNASHMEYTSQIQDKFKWKHKTPFTTEQSIRTN